MTRTGVPSLSWRVLLLVALATTLGAVLLGVRVDSAGDQRRSASTAAVVDRGEPAPPRVAAPSRTGAAADPSRDRSPVRLAIPVIDVATPLVRLGLEGDHTVEVPSDPDDAGWFQPGARPGARGSAVLLGHVDSTSGPAVFARLQELRPGDLVAVERADGTTVRFAVERAVLYDNADFPARRVYAAARGRRLNLVTCGGVYDSAAGGYQSNLVVYTRRVPTLDG